MMKNKIWIFLIFAVFLIGAVGFWLAKFTPLDAAFKAALLYSFGYDGDSHNALIEIARWLAPVTIAGWLLTFFESGKRFLHNKFAYKKQKLAIYGRKNHQKIHPKYHILEISESKFENADIYILFGNDSENNRFLRDFGDRLQNKIVYFHTSIFRPQLLNSQNVRFFSMNENNARSYWKERILAVSEANAEISVVIIGFDKFAQELLYWGLLLNIFELNQKIRYLIFSDSSNFLAQKERFLGLYHELDKINDEVIFFDNSFRANLDKIKNATRVIVCEDCEMVIGDILFALPNVKIDAITDRKLTLSAYENLDKFVNIINFCKFDIDLIIDEIAISEAKNYNFIYEQKFGDKNLDKEAAWQRLNGFKRYSNIALADFNAIRKSVIEAKFPDKKVKKSELEKLAKIEHLRWMRYHLLNNYKFATTTSAENKTHASLVEFEQLSQIDREKDENIAREFLLNLGYEIV